MKRGGIICLLKHDRRDLETSGKQRQRDTSGVKRSFKYFRIYDPSRSEYVGCTGKLVKVFGGAVAADNMSIRDEQVSRREEKNLEEKD